MAANTFTIAFCCLLLLPLAFPSSAAYDQNEPVQPKPAEKKVDVVVEGKVYCQSCDHHGTWSLAGAEPIPYAKISVICKNYRNQVSFYKAYEADEHGFFYAQLDGFKMGHRILDHPLHSCQVKLVSSPLANCSLFSDVNYGVNGAPLRYQNKVLRGSHYEAVIYAAGPVAFRPTQCPPATHA